jgi:adenylate cyclase
MEPIKIFLFCEIARYLADEFELQNFRPAPLRLTGDVTAYDYYLRGLEYLKLPNSHETVDLAIQLFNTSLVHDKNFSLANAGLCDAYWKKYEVSSSARWLTDAERYCLLAISQNENSALPYKAIGAIYRDTGRYQQAIEYLEKGVLVDGDSVATAVSLASVYSLINEKDRAEKIYVDTISKSPNNWEAYEGYAYYLMMGGRYDEAIQNYEKVLDFMPENVFVLSNIASIYLYKYDFKRAAEIYEMAAKIEPSGVIFANIGIMYYTSGDFEKAVFFYSQALRLEPESYQYMTYIADAYKFIPGKKIVAEKYFRDVIRFANEEISFNKDIARTYQSLAISFSYLGDIDKANEALSVAYKLEPESAETSYSYLRVAVLMSDYQAIRKHVVNLLKTEYSVRLLLADPDFYVLKEDRFDDLFVE